MPKYFVPNICATIPLVAGTVESHKKPKLAPNKNALKLLAGVNINKIIDIPHRLLRENATTQPLI